METLSILHFRIILGKGALKKVGLKKIG